MKKPSKPSRTAPAYPTRPQLLSKPSGLLEHIPSAWKGLVSAGGLAVAFLVSGLSGCGDDPAEPAAAPRTPPAASSPAAAAASDKTLLGAAICAPLFQHGEGRAATGCVVIAPPVFLTEEEARQIIIEELQKAGVKLSAQDVELKDVHIKPKSRSNVMTKGGKSEVVHYEEEARPFRVDLMDADRRVAVEFVSKADYLELGGEQAMSTVQSYDFKKVAQSVSEQVKRDGQDGYFGVFYEPTSHIQRSIGPAADELKGKTQQEQQEIWQKAWKAAEQEARRSSREELRLQVRDFAQWLRQRGVI